MRACPSRSAEGFDQDQGLFMLPGTSRFKPRESVQNPNETPGAPAVSCTLPRTSSISRPPAAPTPLEARGHHGPPYGRAFSFAKELSDGHQHTSSRRRFAKRWARGPPARRVVEAWFRPSSTAASNPRSPSACPTATSTSRSTAAASSPRVATIAVGGEKVRAIPRDYPARPGERPARACRLPARHPRARG